MILAAALSLSLQLVRTSFDMLDGVSVEVIVHNPQTHPVTATFPAPSEYELDLTDGKKQLWTTLQAPPPGAHFPAHTHVFMPGPTVLAIYVWNGVLADGSVPAPGTYRFRARLLDVSAPPEAFASVHFIKPVPVSALAKLKLGDEVTIAGTLAGDSMHLTDSTGTVALMRKLANAAKGTVVIRGYIVERPDHTRAFYIKRWGMMLEDHV